MPGFLGLSSEQRRMIAEARARARDNGASSGDTPFTDIPSQQAPKQVPYWEPGKLYQPGDLVQANNYGDIAQTALTNPSFESGDVGWTKGASWTIANTAGFSGSWRAEYAGQAEGALYFPSDVSGGARVGITDLVTTTNEAFIGTSMVVAANGTTVIAAGRETGDSLAKYSTDAGVTWTTATTVPWTFVDNDIYDAFWHEGTSLFYLLGNATDYWTSPDGDVWTARTLTGGNTFGVVHGVADFNGELHIGSSSRMFKTADGSTWTNVNFALPFTVNSGIAQVGATYYAVDNGGASDRTLWTSTDLDTWTENTTGSAALQAALANIGNQHWIASDGTRLVVGIDYSVLGTDNVVFSTDGGDTWSGSTTSMRGTYLRYAAGLGKFVSLDSYGTDYDIWHSDDGDTWTQYTAFAGFGAVELYGYPSGQAITTGVTTIVNDDRETTFPGQIVTATAKVQTSGSGNAKIGISWYNSGGTLLSTAYGNELIGASSNWREIEVSAIAPLDAATCSVSIAAGGTGTVYADYVEWDHFTQDAKSALIFEATQAAAGRSGEVEPVWPATVGLTVVDNEVTWTARAANCVVWEAKPILLSGATEPTWPTEEGATVEDNTILWTADSGRVKDENCPNTKVVAIAASKIFCADEDIVAYCATVNPLDWSSPDDAGFIPFGMNTYGDEDVSALGIYRSNLVAWNAKAFQMWQVDEDPQNFAILDAIPVGNRFYKSGSPVSNDLVFLTDEGIRNMGTTGASANLQAGYFGKQIDPLVKAAIAAIGDEDDILSFYYPGAGQYWLVFEDTAYVLTMNGGKADMSWSRYTFPSNIDEYTLRDGDLYLRSGEKIWLFDEDAVQDDVGGTPTNFEGRVWWHYLDFGALGITKSLIGFDVVATGTFTVAVGYDQSNTATATTDYSLTGDTLPNGVIPLPVTAPSFQFRLTWAGGEAWQWNASALYLQDWRVTS